MRGKTRKTKMRIAIFSDTFFPQINGVANVAYQSAKSLADLGHEVVVFVASAKSNKETVKNSGNFKVVFYPSMPAFVYPNERAAFPVGISASVQLMKFNPDIIHSHTPFSIGWAAIFAAKSSGAKLVGTHHTFYDHYLKHVKMDYDWGKKLSWKLTVGYYNFCDLVLSPTQSLADGLVENGLGKPVKIFQNPIDTEIFAPVTKIKKDSLKKKFGIPGLSLVYMGRLSYEKSIDQAIMAFALAVKNNPKIRLMLVGDGPEKAKLEQLCSDLKIADKVIFTGVLRDSELAEALQANDAFITASKSENMPLSVLEAMATALPVVAVSEKGLKEMIKDGVSGLLSPADNAEKMSENILKIFSDAKLIKNMGAASRKSAEQYSGENITKSLEEIYKNILINKI